MHFSNLLAFAASCALTAAAPNAIPQSVAGIQANIQAAQGVILTIINDLAQQRSAVADFSALQAGLTPLVTFTCPPATSLAPATSSNQAIGYLQEVQLELNIVSLAIQDADTAGAQNGVCTAITYFTAAGAFITPSVTTASTTTSMPSTTTAPFVCNLAHSYPTPLTCIQTNGTIALVTNTLLPH